MVRADEGPSWHRGHHHETGNTCRCVDEQVALFRSGDLVSNRWHEVEHKGCPLSALTIHACSGKHQRQPEIAQDDETAASMMRSASAGMSLQAVGTVHVWTGQSKALELAYILSPRNEVHSVRWAEADAYAGSPSGWSEVVVYAAYMSDGPTSYRVHRPTAVREV
jgi:hypothetical protein